MIFDLFGNKRAAQMRALAHQLGLKYSRRDEFSLRKKLGAFQLFTKGHGRKISNLMTLEDDWLVSSRAIFDYQYSIQHGKTSSTHAQTVFFMDSKQLGLPPFIIRPEYFFHRIGKFLGLVKDIEFEINPKFSKNFLIQSDYPEMMKDLVPDDLIRFFNVEYNWSLEGVNHYLIFYQSDKKIAPGTIRDFYHKGMSIVDMLKDESQSRA